MIKFSARSVLKQLLNIPGWHTQRHIILFESDDWGSIRMPSIESFKRLEKSGLDLRSADAERFNLNDTLATNKDLESLFEVLSSVEDRYGNCAVFTPVSVVANPDFKKIYNSGFKEYFYEPFTETLKHYPGCEHSFELWKEGIEKRLFIPQMHGREHLNVIAWMKALQTGEKDTLQAFEERLWGFVPAKFPEVDYQAAFLLTNPNELEYQKHVIIDGLQIFKKTFGYKAEYFVPPNGYINNYLNKTLSENGIKYRFVPIIQNEAMWFFKKRRVIHYIGQKEKNGIKYIHRNCIFEPSQQGKDWVDSCLNNIKIAFRWHKPAIIRSHRVNYIGSLNPANRDKGLRQLSELLNKIIKNWPDAEFMTTTQLGELINND